MVTLPHARPAHPGQSRRQPGAEGRASWSRPRLIQKEGVSRWRQTGPLLSKHKRAGRGGGGGGACVVRATAAAATALAGRRLQSMSVFSKMLEWALLSSAIHFRNSTDGGIPECCISAVTPSEKTRMKSWSKWYMFAGARSDGYNEEGCLHLMNSAGYDIVNVDGSQRDPDTFIYHNTSAGWQCNDKDHSKWGWLSPQNGLAAPLGITIRLPPAKLQYEIYLTYLRSYVNMSAFEVTAWCSGQEDKKTMTQLRGQWETQVSISQFDKIVTTTSEGGEQLCHVKIAATEPGKKIKVLAVSATLK